ncbi:MAG: CDP-alcohol phosphatidyltransferase family protein [Gammaproteobacteria bacterium]|jgi:phosphatidylglycerophosphate synthase|nr:CDP-alcohol phosphatidyltransferase family protein [Gammaproteobacteria bacterium]
MSHTGIKRDLALGAAAAGALSLFLASNAPLPWLSAAVTLAAYGLVAGLVGSGLRGRRTLGWANRLTLLRAIVCCVLAGALVHPDLFIEQAGFVIALAIAALALDGLDGWLARRLGETTAFGARFDMETDAALILLLCAGLWSSGLAPAWVLAIGLMRPAFVIAGLALPWLSRSLPESLLRKFVCTVQVAALPVALLPTLGEAPRLTVLAAALIALVVSFAIDVFWLFRHRQAPRHSLRRTP